MQLIFAGGVTVRELVEAVSLTLVHSLWQGLLLAALAGTVIMLTGKSGAARRYNLLAILFFLFVSVSCYTFYLQLNKAGQTTNAGIEKAVQPQFAISNNAPVVNVDQLNTNQDLIIGWLLYFKTHAALVVTIWLIVFSAKLVRAMAGLGYIQRIKHYKVTDPGGEWKQRLQQLAAQLDIHTKILFLESKLVKVPLTAGFIKPVIIFPLGLLANLDPYQVEAILLHELAHIKRKDYFINMLQSFAESIFFFNPAVLWLSALIKEEREHCCDDIAIAVSQDKTRFITALVSFQEYSMQNTNYAMAFPGRRNHLLERVKRIIYNHNKTLNNMEKFFVTASFAMAVLLTVAFLPSHSQTVSQKNVTDTTQRKTDVDNIEKEKKNMVTDEEYYENEDATIETTKNNKRYKIVFHKNVITELYIDQVKIADEKIASYKSETNEIIKEVKAVHNKALKAKQQAELSKIEALQMKEKAEQYSLQAQQYKLQAELLEKQAVLSKIDAEKSGIGLAEIKEDGLQNLRQAEQLKELTEAIENQTSLSKADKIKIKESRMQAAILTNMAEKRVLLSKLNASILKEKTEQDEIQVMQVKLQAELEDKQAELSKIDAEQSVIYSRQAKEQAELSRKYAAVSKARAEQGKKDAIKLHNAMLDDLVNAGIIKDRKNVSIQLNNESLIVNGIKQPDAVYKKFKDKYVKGKGWQIDYSEKGSTITDLKTDEQ